MAHSCDKTAKSDHRTRPLRLLIHRIDKRTTVRHAWMNHIAISRCPNRPDIFLQLSFRRHHRTRKIKRTDDTRHVPQIHCSRCVRLMSSFFLQILHSILINNFNVTQRNNQSSQDSARVGWRRWQTGPLRRHTAHSAPLRALCSDRHSGSIAKVKLLFAVKQELWHLDKMVGFSLVPFEIWA